MATLDSAGIVHGFAAPRKALPFSLSAIAIDPRTGRGNGRVARMVIKRQTGAPLVLTCWVPSAESPKQIVAAMKGSSDTVRWKSVLAELAGAKHVPNASQRSLSPEAREFEAEMIAADSTNELMYGGQIAALSAQNSASVATSPPLQKKLTEGCDGYLERSGPTRPAGTATSPVHKLDDSGCSCFEWDDEFWFDGDTWNWNIDFYFCSGGSTDDYAWMIDNDYWQLPCGGTAADARDSIRAMYDNTSLFAGQPYKPACTDFVSNVSTTYFSWSELSAQLVRSYNGSLIGVFKSAMLGSNGLDALRTAWGSALTLNSTYRDPQKNQDIGSTALKSQHMYGAAADINNPGLYGSNPDSVWQALFNVASDVPSATTLTGSQDPLCSRSCVHIDWRTRTQ